MSCANYKWLRNVCQLRLFLPVKLTCYLQRCDPIRRQLLGASATGGYGYSSPSPEDVPLRAWLEEHLGTEAVPACVSGTRVSPLDGVNMNRAFPGDLSGSLMY